MALRKALNITHERAREVIAGLVADKNILERMKFEPLGCDPLDPADPQNLAEQIDQQATHEAAVDALEYLWTKHPECEWMFAPGARGSGYDIESSDGLVAAEVFAAVRPKSNRKLTKDIEKVGKFAGTNAAREFPRLCRGGSRSLTDTDVGCRNFRSAQRPQSSSRASSSSSPSSFSMNRSSSAQALARGSRVGGRRAIGR